MHTKDVYSLDEDEFFNIFVFYIDLPNGWQLCPHCSNGNVYVLQTKEPSEIMMLQNVNHLYS